MWQVLWRSDYDILTTVFCTGICCFMQGRLSMFYVQVRDDDGNLNNIEVQRLKDKLGTRAVPTAELLLDGTRAIRVNEQYWLRRTALREVMSMCLCVSSVSISIS